MADPALNNSNWTNRHHCQDVFNGQVGAAWFRTTLDPLALAGRPLTLHFLSVADNATVFLNGALLGQPQWRLTAVRYVISGCGVAQQRPNVLAVAVQNTGVPAASWARCSCKAAAKSRRRAHP